jgi:hypothetical protein
MLRNLALINCLSLFLISTTAQALPDKGSCANYDFSEVMDEHGHIDTSQFVRVLRDNAPLYQEADSQTPKLKRTSFGDYLLPLQIVKRNYGKQQRIQVRRVGTHTALGWMEAHDLLCGVKPLQSSDGLDRKVFIKTPSRRDPNQSTVSAYKSYELGWTTEGCQQLARFRLYFIYAEDNINQRYLIIDKHTLEGHSSPPPLVGWVKLDDTIPWNTTLGLRPKENVKRISAYATLEDSHNENKKQGVELAGGKIWYTFENHIPTLEITENHYHVVVPKRFEGYEGAVDFYIPVDKSKVQEEVWMTADNLDDWLSLLKPLKNLAGLPVSKQREVFVRLLRKQVQEIIGAYPRYEITLSEVIAEAKKKVLPMRQNSPLLQYSIKEIREEIEACEVTRLINWVIDIRRVLQRVFNDSTQKPVFTLEYPSRSTHCPLSEKGKRVPELKFGRVVAQALGPNDNHRYDHRLYGQTVYWLPIDFLP